MTEEPRVMNAKYEIHFHDPAGKLPMTAEIFDKFDALKAYIVANRKPDWSGRVNVHFPAHSTDGEREAIRSMGFESN